MKASRIFQAIWLGPTDTLGHRVRLICHRTGRRITIPVKWDSEDETARQVAQRYLESRGIMVTGWGEATRGYILFSNDFETQLK